MSNTIQGYCPIIVIFIATGTHDEVFNRRSREDQDTGVKETGTRTPHTPHCEKRIYDEDITWEKRIYEEAHIS